jgi:hypothetical protein
MTSVRKLEDAVSEESRLIRRELRSPPSAAVAGIVYAILMTISMVLLRKMASVDPADLDGGTLRRWSRTASLALGLVPFAGIALLWFTGVIRDRLGVLEDKFFSTIFLGSGVISVVLMFIWAATGGAVFRTFALVGGKLADPDVYIFGFALVNEIVGNYAVRMAGVYMTSIGALWTRTGVMPRWLSIITFVVALGFLFFANSIRQARFVFPGWVLLVSVYILVVNYRRTRRREGAGSDASSSVEDGQ